MKNVTIDTTSSCSFFNYASSIIARSARGRWSTNLHNLNGNVMIRDGRVEIVSNTELRNLLDQQVDTVLQPNTSPFLAEPMDSNAQPTRPPQISMKMLPAWMLLLLFCTVSTHAATQVGSAPYKVSSTGAGNSCAPVFSADGQHVAFVSHANNLVTNDDLAPHLDLFVRDLVASNTVLVSVRTNGFGGANDNIGFYTLSSNAQVIAFETLANNLAPGDTNRWRDIYVRDLASGVTRLVTPNANGPSSNPLTSEDGQRVIFESLASNLVTNDFNGTNDIFIHDLTTGVTELVTLNASNTASPDGPSHSPSISADGLTVAFVSHATNLVEGVTNKLGEVYARKVAEGTTRWAVASHIEEAHARVPNSNELLPYAGFDPVLCSDGRFVLFKTEGAAFRFDLQLATNSFFQWSTQSIGGVTWRELYRHLGNPVTAGDVASKSPMSFSKNGRYAALETQIERALVRHRPGRDGRQHHRLGYSCPGRECESRYTARLLSRHAGTVKRTPRQRG